MTPWKVLFVSSQILKKHIEFLEWLVGPRIRKRNVIKKNPDNTSNKISHLSMFLLFSSLLFMVGHRFLYHWGKWLRVTSLLYNMKNIWKTGFLTKIPEWSRSWLCWCVGQWPVETSWTRMWSPLRVTKARRQWFPRTGHKIHCSHVLHRNWDLPNNRHYYTNNIYYIQIETFRITAIII